MIDYHVHTSFSGDCEETMEQTVKTAILKGGTEICFTDHLDYDYPTEENFKFDSVAFKQEFDRIKDKYGHDISMKMGIEVGLQAHVINETREFLKGFEADFVLCSFHVADYQDMYNGDFYNNRTSEDAWLTYFNDVKKVLHDFKDYSVVGHLDIPKRYNEKARQVSLDSYSEILTEVLNLIIKDNKGIEVNMSGLRTDQNETLPSREILELYFELGGRNITIGSDAHYHQDVYSHYHQVIEMLKDIGFTAINTYHKMQIHQHKI